MQEFTFRSARSGSLLVGLAIAIVVEALALHLWLVDRHAAIAWALTVSSFSVLIWLVADYQAIGRGVVRLSADALALHIGRRFNVRLLPSDVAMAVRPGWRDVPQAGTPAASDYLNLTKPATPNVLLALVAPTPVRLPGGFSRSIHRLGLHLDDPEAFLSAFKELSMPARAVRESPSMWTNASP